MATEPDDTLSPFVSDEIETVSVRRAPKYGVFLVAGAALGILAAMILTQVFARPEEISTYTGIEYSPMQVFGFIVLACVPIGLVVGAVVALLLDRTLARRGRELRVDHERVVLPE